MSPYILAASERAALPISVDYREYNHQQRRNGARDHFEISWPGNKRTLFMFRDEPDAAARAYLSLCESLSNPDTVSSLSATSADRSAPSPEGVA